MEFEPEVDVEPSSVPIPFPLAAMDETVRDDIAITPLNVCSLCGKLRLYALLLYHLSAENEG